MDTSTFKPILKKIGKITAITIASILILLAIIPLIFNKTVNSKVSSWATQNLNGELKFKDINLSFYKHFPNLTATVYNVDLKGSAPFKNETLLKANEVAFGIDILSVFSDQIAINKFYVDDAFINIQTDSLGQANYNVYKSDTTQTKTGTDTSSISLKIDLIKIENSHLVYNDRSLPMTIDAKGFNYMGRGNLSNDIFDLGTHAQIDSLNFSYDNQQYLENKKVDAKLLTKVNTNSLAFIFEKNDLIINNLPVTFTGKFAFISNGYDMDFRVSTLKSNLKNILSALPKEYVDWANKTTLDGVGDIYLSLIGQYIAQENKMPDAKLKVNITDGFINHQDAPFPIKNLFLKMETELPNCDINLVKLNVDSIYFNLDKDFFSGILKVDGLTPLKLSSKIKSELDLEKFDKALGINDYDFKGKLAIDFIADGTLKKGIEKSGVRKIDSVITQIPVFNFQSELKNGYFKLNSLPQAVENIQFKINSTAKDSLFQNIQLSLTDLNMNVLSNYLKGYIKIDDFKNFPVDGHIESSFNLSDIPKFYPLDSIEIKGDLAINALIKGNYLPKKRIFPVTKTAFSLTKGYLKSLALPQLPIENVSVITNVTSNKGSFKDLKVEILPISFTLAGKPFELKANLENFDNVKYKINSKGEIDLVSIYKIFAIDGYNLDGFIKTNFNLQGLQSDALAGRFNRLKNFGTLDIDNIKVNSDLFPKDFVIHNGRFAFLKEKMLFKSFNGSYGESKFTLNGHLTDFINYIVNPNGNLNGKFNISSKLLNTNELMAYADNSANSSTNSSASGVILIPENLNINFSANIDKIKYDDLILQNFKGSVATKNATVVLENTNFDLIGTKVTMNADYAPINPKKAKFNYAVKAENFDIQRAYKEVALFREMATSAKNAYGIISLDYSLSGSLDENMYPIMPSLSGQGVLSLEKIKFKGFKLMNNIASKTSNSSLKDPNVSKVEIKSSIKNNILTIERTKMKIAGFRPRFEGQVSLDGKLNMGMRLGLPPLGIFGIPIKVTGTQENPIIKIGKQTKEDELEETIDN